MTVIAKSLGIIPLNDSKEISKNDNKNIPMFCQRVKGSFSFNQNLLRATFFQTLQFFSSKVISALAFRCPLYDEKDL